MRLVAGLRNPDPLPMLPLVSAIIPAFNRELTIARSVRSVLSQTYRNLELIVVDDGSSDGTVEALAQFEGRIVILRQENGGPSLARNLGASHARGAILAFLDSDDEWLPDKIEKQVRLMQAYGPSMPCCVCNASYTDGTARTSFELAGLSTQLEVAILENPVAVLTSTFLLFNQVAAIRREAFERIGGYNEELRLLEDYELSLRLATLGPWGVLREALVLKNEDTVGIGVAAMKDELKHLAAQEAVLESILANPTLQQASIRKPIAAKLRRARRHQSVHRRMLTAPRLMRPVGRAILLFDRISRAIARRMPGAVRPKITRA
jgi:glycosyltransferase involved in cell wall biosynthesis